jgi:hypothetical protein
MRKEKTKVSKNSYWLSFANAHGFGGVVIVDLDLSGKSKADKILAAVSKTIELGVNPGPQYSVQMQTLPVTEISDRYKNRLLTAAEVDALSAQARALH